MEQALRVSEIFHSIQGESTRAGRPCVFVRLAGCHLRCRYCDTTYAFRGGQRTTVEEVLERVKACGTTLVEVTGGEPLLQKGAPLLIRRLCDEGFETLVETSGACDIDLADRRAVRVMDVKTPGSGECDRMDWDNIERLTRRDEVKFVLCDRADYEWARTVVRERDLPRRVGAVLFSPVVEQPGDADVAGAKGLALRDLAGWILEDRLPVTLQIQLHKLIWGPATRGV